MSGRVRSYFRRERAIATLGAFFWLVSFILMPTSIMTGLAWSSKVGARGFFQKPNWFLYPLFFPALLWLAYITWHDYTDAWKSIRTEGVLHTPDFRRADREHLGRLLRMMGRVRPILFLAACACGLLLTTIDSHSAFSLLSWQPQALAAKCVDRDFFIAPVLADGYFPRASWTSGIWFGTWCYLMQGALIALGFLCLFQIVFQGALFTFFESTHLARHNRLSISLRADDPVGEFGLERWNYAINRGYVFVAVGMAIPLISHLSQIGGSCQKSTGQTLFALSLWAILLAPILLPILARFSRKREIVDLVTKANDSEFAKAVDQQKLWPFDKDHIGKIALAFSFCEYLLISDLIHTDKVVDWIFRSLGG